MASHKGWDRVFPVTSVALSGGSFNLAKGQLALVDLEAPATANTGLKLTSSLLGLSKKRKLQLRVGKHDIRNNRSQSSKDWSTESFMVTQILDLQVDAPQSGILTDEFIVGYNGIDDSSAIVLAQGANEVIALNLCGEIIGALGYQEAEVEVKMYLEQPNEGALTTSHQLIEDAVTVFNNMKLMGDIPITDFVEAVPVNNENAAITGTDTAFWSLVVEDEGDSNALAAVQAQYNGLKVVRTDRAGLESTYTVVEDVPTSVTTTNFVIGVEYVITTVGDTDFTLIGASSNTVGVIFTATGVGGGTTGVADTVEVTDFVKTKAWKVKGCATCPTGYSVFVDGFVYSITLEDDGADSTATIEAISANTEGGSAVRVNLDGGLSTYTVVVNQELTPSEIAAFVATNEESEITLITANAAEICTPDNSTSFTWVAGDVCKIETESYTITLADDECGNSRLAELQLAYPQLTISSGATGGCQGVYTTDVNTNIVCDGCSDFFRAMFVSEAPLDYDMKSWIAVAKVYSATAKMGIKFKAKPIQLHGSEVYRDDMPFIASSVKMSLAGGHEVNINESFYAGRTGRFDVTILSIGSEPENWGGNLREFEDITKRYQEGVSRHEGNNYGKGILGEETMLKANMPYVDYILTVRTEKYAQSFSGELNETYQYHFLVEPGAHMQVETLLNVIAAEAGVETVQAYAKDA